MAKDVHVNYINKNIDWKILCSLNLYIADCENSCDHCSECVLPGVCICTDGWTGDDCCTGISHISHVSLYNDALYYIRYQWM